MSGDNGAPPSLSDWVADDGLAAFLNDTVDELDLGPLLAAHDEPRGKPPYHPALMLKVLLYGYATGVRSSRKLEARCAADVNFMFLAGQARPDHKTISEFRRRHLAAFSSLFVEVLALCQRAGLVRLGRVALDGTKLRANASKHKAMSYGRMVKREAELAAEVRAILDEAEAIDAAEDAEFGDARGDELPPELARRETRLGSQAHALTSCPRDLRCCQGRARARHRHRVGVSNVPLRSDSGRHPGRQARGMATRTARGGLPPRRAGAGAAARAARRASLAARRSPPAGAAHTGIAFRPARTLQCCHRASGCPSPRSAHPPRRWPTR